MRDFPALTPDDIDRLHGRKWPVVVFVLVLLAVAAGSGALYAWWVRPFGALHDKPVLSRDVGQRSRPDLDDGHPPNLYGCWVFDEYIEGSFFEARMPFVLSSRGVFYCIVPPDQPKRLILPLVFVTANVSLVIAKQLTDSNDVVRPGCVKFVKRDNGMDFWDITYKSNLRRTWEMLSYADLDYYKLDPRESGPPRQIKDRAKTQSNLAVLTTYYTGPDKIERRVSVVVIRRTPYDEMKNYDGGGWGAHATKVAASMDAVNAMVHGP